MIPAGRLREVRKLELRCRRLVSGSLGGEYRSAFKGTGLVFADVRPYQPGDDVRSIDWNVTARSGEPFLKRFTEEREQSLLLALDVSRSLQFGPPGLSKRQVGAELAALLALAALSNNDRVGLLLFTDTVELFLPPRKGQRHADRLIRELLAFPPRGSGTNLAVALESLVRLVPKRSIVLFVSDFPRGSDFSRPLQLAARRHELIAVDVHDPRESQWPDAGLVVVEDSETGEQRWIDSGNQQVRNSLRAAELQRRDDLRRQMAKAHAELLEISTDGRHFDALTGFLRRRHKAGIRP